MNKAKAYTVFVSSLKIISVPAKNSHKITAPAQNPSNHNLLKTESDRIDIKAKFQHLINKQSKSMYSAIFVLQFEIISIPANIHTKSHHQHNNNHTNQNQTSSKQEST